MMLYGLIGLAIVCVAVAIVVERRRNARAKANGNGFDQLAESAKRCKCRDV